MSLLKRMTKEQRMSFVKSLLDVERTFLNLGKAEMEEIEIAKTELYIELLEKELDRLNSTK